MSQPHEQFAELTGLYVLDALTDAERDAFEAHAAGCARCMAEIRELRRTAAALALSAPPAAPSPAVRDRLMAAVSADRGTGAPGVKLQGVGAPGVKTVKPARAPIAPWLAAAAALALALALAGYVVELRRGARSEQLIAAVLAAPDLARIDLVGQPTAPSASARAFWSRSRGLVFTASNLPVAPAGRVYQLWVLSSQPAPTSAGLLKPDASGRVTASFNTPADLPQPVAMAVTLEPEGGVPAPTGDKYLVGLAN
ncbi:MAG TPA: anti-sigma factor [Vicinamibacterales bacterium]|jgi:anti-sigma-K factor RskA|nr:anti-sigma factor [Vicinamibacterales bacterium]